MNDDFNPFDLSAAPKPVEKPKVQEIPNAKPIVKRVSLGPLFHSRITRTVAFILGFVLLALVGYVGMNYYLDHKATVNKPVSQVSTPSGSSSGSLAASTTPAATNTAAAQTTANTSSSATTAASPTVYCGVSGMPQGACTAITSIEKDGIKNNQYVTADTSNLPDGTTVDVDQRSWSQSDASDGSANFVATAAGQTYNGAAAFQVVASTWKVVSYTLS